MSPLMSHNRIGGDSLLLSLRKLLHDGRDWVSAEFALARAEISADGKRLVSILILAACAIASAIAAMVLLGLFVTALIAPYVGGLANAAGCLAVVMIIITVVSAVVMLRMVRSNMGISTVIKRWRSVATEGPGGQG